eukprot:CAMPEP_0195097208 /NCGR_PEP_ID=MMETSP0448-20130528/52003_1 /TAXON_ID=66468 /ORGANISM="Heterocapsa triquestra, Strain CCMP 448" /LENGTH=54 /DNA_ID=CAMNT_0040131693 /DNA_START=29 /DNA_END=193 /DNA_ORIENTATION=+
MMCWMVEPGAPGGAGSSGSPALGSSPSLPEWPSGTLPGGECPAACASGQTETIS